MQRGLLILLPVGVTTFLVSHNIRGPRACLYSISASVSHYLSGCLTALDCHLQLLRGTCSRSLTLEGPLQAVSKCPVLAMPGPSRSQVYALSVWLLWYATLPSAGAAGNLWEVLDHVGALQAVTQLAVVVARAHPADDQQLAAPVLHG